MLIAIFATLVYIGIIPLLKFKTIVYENDKGQKFKLSFYSQYSTGKILSPSSVASNDSLFLIAKKGKNGKAPVAMNISEAPYNAANSSAYVNNERCGSLPIKFSTHNKYINKDINVCSLSPQQGKDIMYLSTFHDEKSLYVIVILQNIDFNKAYSSKEDAQSLLDKIDLSGYDDELKTTLASIKPL